MPRRIARNVPVIVAISVGLVLLVSATLGWLGWRLLSQEEALVRQQSRDRLEQAADTLLAGFLRTVSDAELSLAQITSSLPADESVHLRDGGVLVMFSRRGVDTLPPAALPYHPTSPTAPFIDPTQFRDSDILEFQTHDFDGAAAKLGQHATSKDRTIRAEALLRLARVQTKSGQIGKALDTYERLRDEELMSSVDAPYGLVSRFTRTQLLANVHQDDAARREATALLNDLESGQFAVGKDSYAWYDGRTRKLAGVEARSTPHIGLAMAAVVEAIWDEWQIFQRSGSRTLSKRLHEAAPIPVLAVLNANPDRLVALIRAGDSIRYFGLDPAASGDQQPFRVTVLDEHGTPIVGQALGSSAAQATRVLSAAEIPWRLTLQADSDDAAEGLLATRRIYFGVALGSVVLLVSAACYAMARGVLREAAAGRLQSDFVSAVSHEFRSPLTTLRQLTELLAHGRISDESRRRLYFDVLQKETARLHQLVENLLDFGRMDAGRRQYQLEPVDLAELVRDGIEQYRTESSSNAHTIELTADRHALVVNADREALRRVVRNLLENAVKYSPDSPTVWVETKGEGSSAVLRVRDEGIGIPAEEQSRIFEKFVRGEGAKRACIPGTGVGLAMVKEIVHVHHGDLHLSSEVGRGSTFQVRLPLCEAHGSVQ